MGTQGGVCTEGAQLLLSLCPAPMLGGCHGDGPWGPLWMRATRLEAAWALGHLLWLLHGAETKLYPAGLLSLQPAARSQTYILTILFHRFSDATLFVFWVFVFIVLI